MINSKILLIDDEEELVTTWKERLAFRDIKAIAVTSGPDAFEVLKQETIDAVVLDVKMPGMDGFEILKIIKEDYPDLPVILITGHESPVKKDKIIESAHGYLVKPVSFAVLLQVLEEAIYDKNESD